MSIFIDTFTSDFFWLVFDNTIFLLFLQAVLFDEENGLFPKENDSDFKLAIMSLLSLTYCFSRFKYVDNDKVRILLFMNLMFIGIICLQRILL